MLFDSVSIIFGLVFLLAGAEIMVRGASALAIRLRVSPLLVGLTVVSVGTSTPELVVNIFAAFDGSSDLALGNIVGSNISNILLILGATALIVPLTVRSSTVWKEIPLALMGVILLFIMTNDRLFDGVGFNALTRTDGFALLSLMVVFMYYVYGLAKRERSAKTQKATKDAAFSSYSLLAAGLMVVLGILGLVLGGRLLVDGAVGMAESVGLSEALIGLTIVAIGTSLPELATSLVAALRNKADLAIGNIVGSNIFNVFFVLGITSLIVPLEPSQFIDFDIIVSVVATVLLLAFMFVGKKHKLTRIQGGIFVGLYVLYLIYIIFRG